MANPNWSGTRALPRIGAGVAFQEHMGQASDFIAMKILPPMPSAIQGGYFPKLKRSSILRPGVVKRAAGAGYSRFAVEAKDDSFLCQERGAESLIDDGFRKVIANDFDIMERATLECVEKILLDLEIDVAAAIFDPTTNWPSGDSTLYTDVSSAPWDTASSDVITAVLNAKEKVRRLTGMKPNTLVLAESQFQNLLKNDDIILRFPGSPLITEADLEANLARIFGLKQVLRGGAVKNTASEGETEVVSDVWTDDYAWVGVVPMGGGITPPGVGRTVVFTPDSPEEVLVEIYRDDSRRSDVVRARLHTDEKIVDTSFGHLLKID